MKTKRLAVVMALTAVMAPAAAFAHPGHSLSGLGAGLAHPFLGLDHLLAMVAVGVWAAQQPAGRAWQGPVLFVAMLGAGALIAIAGWRMPFAEPGVAASVILLGLMVAGASRVPASAGLAAIAAFAVMHGHAHGAEAVAPIGGYVAGFLAASALLHTGGYAAGRLLTPTRYGVAVAGLAIAAAGAALAVG